MPSTPFAGPESGNILIVEDDPADALLAQDFLAEEAAGAYTTTWVRTLDDAVGSLSTDTTCVLLDLGLPDSNGTAALETLHAAAPEVPIVVLTGLGDRSAGMRAVAAGAQDYLVKGDVTPTSLLRAVRYSVERRKNEVQGLHILHSEARRDENERLARGLLPTPVLRDDRLTASRRYKPGGDDALLGGDFFDAVELDDGTLRVMIGDVCGHGPDEAALGVSLRIAWRALVFSRHEDGLFDALETLIALEAEQTAMFVTMCDVTISPDRRSASVRLAGHPPPLVHDGSSTRPLPCTVRTPLGVVNAPHPVGAANPDELSLPAEWSLLLYTDGIYEGHDGATGARLELDGLTATLDDLRGPGRDGRDLLDALVDRVEELHGGSLEDDVALLLLDFRSAGRSVARA